LVMWVFEFHSFSESNTKILRIMRNNGTTVLSQRGYM
jgi:hypothetical protein